MTTQAAETQRLVTLVRAQFGRPDLVLHLTRLLAAGQPITLEEAAAAASIDHPELQSAKAARIIETKAAGGRVQVDVSATRDQQ
jgi:hypothetical protein